MTLVPLCCLCLFTFFSPSSSHHLALHSFPTRRSSDLDTATVAVILTIFAVWATVAQVGPFAQTGPPEIGRAHVELQSLRHLVCRLLLEKKKKNKKEQN